MHFVRAVVLAAAAASTALGAAVNIDSDAALFNPTAKPLATPVYESTEVVLTNGERMRRGMAPLPPRVRRRGLHGPGPVIPPAPEPSAAPPQPSDSPESGPKLVFEGIVQVAKPETREVIGYVSNKMTILGQFGIDKDYSNPIEVTFQTTQRDQKPGSIKINNGDDRSGAFFGAVASQWMLGALMGFGKDSFSYLARTAETKFGVGPMNIANSILSMIGMKLKAQSAVWTANPITRELSSHWTNTGGEVLDTVVFYHKKLNALALTHDADAFAAAHPDAVKVLLSIIPKPIY